MSHPTPDESDSVLKGKHRELWARGHYDRMVTEIVAELGSVVVKAAGVGPGHRVLDIAAGTGNAAIRAARTGATVVASDLTPELLEIGRRRAEAEGLELEWHEADAEHLPYADGEFDIALSVVGIMFTPHHPASAAELVRVVRPGGTISLINWTPEGFVGQLFAAAQPFAPPPLPGSCAGPQWGNEEYVRELLGGRVCDLRAERRTLTVDRFETAVEFRDYFKINYGPTISVYGHIAGDVEKVVSLDKALVDLGRRFNRGMRRMEWEYLLVTATRV